MFYKNSMINQLIGRCNRLIIMKLSKYIILSFLSFVILTACGGTEKKEEASKKVKIGTIKNLKQKDDNIANIVLTGDDFMQFNKKEIKVKAGQKVKLTLRHIGKMNVKLMGHNVVILKKNVNLIGFATAAATSRDNDYIPKDTKDVLIHTKMIGGGQTTSIEFDAPDPGTYEFLCSFPGHYGMMKGKFIVE